MIVGGQLRLIDFGSSLVIPEGDTENNDCVDVTEIVGTDGFLPPECFCSVAQNIEGGSSRFVTRLR